VQRLTGINARIGHYGPSWKWIRNIFHKTDGLYDQTHHLRSLFGICRQGESIYRRDIGEEKDVMLQECIVQLEDALPFSPWTSKSDSDR